MDTSDVISISETSNEDVSSHRVYKIPSKSSKNTMITEFFNNKRGKKRKFINKKSRKTDSIILSPSKSTTKRTKSSVNSSPKPKYCPPVNQKKQNDCDQKRND